MTDWLARLNISSDQIRISGPSDPMGVSIKFTCDQFAEMRRAYDIGDTPFNCAAKPRNPYRDKINELLPRSAQIQQRRKLIEKSQTPEFSLDDDSYAEQVTLANGKTETIIKHGVGLKRVEPDDPDIKVSSSKLRLL